MNFTKLDGGGGWVIYREGAFVRINTVTIAKMSSANLPSSHCSHAFVAFSYFVQHGGIKYI